MTLFTLVNTLHEKIGTVCPIHGVAIGRLADKSTWRIDFKPEATTQQRADAQAVVAAFDVAAEEKKLTDADQAKKDKKALLLTQLNKSITVQDLLDLGLI